MSNLQQRIEEQEKIEVAVFWDEISRYLPKSLERAALGDEKIFLALKIAYSKIRKYLINSAIDQCLEALGEEKENDKEHKGTNLRDECESCIKNTGYNTHLKESKEALLKLKINPSSQGEMKV